MERGTFLKRTAVIGAILTSGCTFQVPLQTRIPVRSGMERSATRVELVAPTSFADQKYDASGMFWIGFGHTWRFSTGREVVGSSQQIYRSFFQDVKVSKSKTEKNGSYPLVIFPEIQEFEVSSVSMRTKVVLTYQIRDPSDHLIHQCSVEGHSSFGGPQLAGVFFGVLGGKYALSDSASDALNAAYENLERDLEKAVRTGALEPSTHSTHGPTPRHGSGVSQ